MDTIHVLILATLTFNVILALLIRISVINIDSKLYDAALRSYLIPYTHPFGKRWTVETDLGTAEVWLENVVFKESRNWKYVLRRVLLNESLEGEVHIFVGVRGDRGKGTGWMKIRADKCPYETAKNVIAELERIVGRLRKDAKTTLKSLGVDDRIVERIDIDVKFVRNFPDSCEDDFLEEIHLKERSPELVYFKVTNKTDMIFRNLQVMVNLKSFRIIKNPELVYMRSPNSLNNLNARINPDLPPNYDNLMHNRGFYVDRVNYVNVEAPHELGPNSHFIFPLWIDTPDAGDYDIEFIILSVIPFKTIRKKLRVKVIGN